MVGSYLAVVDSYISQIYSSNYDSQAIEGAYGPGPYKIHNDYLEAAAENIMFGGTGAPPGYTCSLTSGGGSAATLSGCVDSAGNVIPVPAVGTQVMLLSGGLSNPNNWTTIRSVSGNSVTYDPVASPPDSGPSMKWGLIPQDIEITNNTFYKPSNWNSADPSYDGIYRDVKDLFEMKYGVRVLVNGNWMENTWNAGQSEAVNINSNDQDGDCPWCRTTDVTFTNNLLKNIGSGDFGVIPAQTYAVNAGPPAPLARVLIGNNLFWPTNNKAIVLASYIGVGAVGGNIESLQFVHNTMPNSYEFFTLSGTPPLNYTNFVFRDNIMERAEYGAAGGPGTEGPDYISKSISSGGLWTATNNGLINSSAGTGQDQTNATLATWYGSMVVPTVVTGEGGVGFSNLANVKTDYHGWVLSSTSPFHNAASDGTDIGVNLATLDAGLGGTMPPAPPPTITGLPDPLLNLPSTLPINSTIQLTNASSYSGASFTWTFTPQSGAGSSSRVSALSSAATISASSQVPQFSLATLNLSLGTYVITVQAQGNGQVSKTASATVTLVNADLSAVKVYPNPWRSDKHAGKMITFANLPVNTRVKIFTTSGHLAKDLGTVSGQVPWDLTNDSGDKVGSGIYLYLITDSAGNKLKGKLAVIK